MLDVVCYYVDIGRPYGPLLERMTASVRETMPDARLILLTPSKGIPEASCFDEVIILPNVATVDNLCLERARATVSWMLSTPRRAVFADPDIIFRNPVEFDGTFDVGVVWRKGKPDQPINTGLVIAEPGRPKFWRHYGAIAMNLPEEIHGWWCDQLAYSVLIGAAHRAEDRLLIDDARVLLMDSRRVCAKPDHASSETWTVHYKGALKGDGWNEIFIKSQCDGKSSQATA